ncbi:ATP-dependent zinc metalloprotease FtsH [uncultured Ruminobacter sp.]|uniref:ATP-dependent zinc metalloprotease FtsH n=1 Tax=uncultured Ruminobacter sp. TaxID=538947 RepID=UPI0025D6BFF5|nr:ATP-dependent zinc metalloprotease FtsH [uncultured Ruminobacter sp.]
MRKNLLMWLIVAVVVIYGFSSFNDAAENASSKSDYVAFKSEVAAGQVKSVKIDGRSITGYRKNGEKFKVVMPIVDQDLLPKLEENKVETVGVLPEEPSLLLSIFVSWFPMIILIFVWIWFMRSAQGGGKGAFSFSKSKAREFREDEVHTTFADVAGCDEAKDEVKELVDYLKEPGKFQKLGGKIPRGVLLVGQPGTGKTLLAKAIAGEAKVPFFSISGSDFVEMFVGVGASRVRDLFAKAKTKCPCIIFIDEIDAVGRKRGIGIGGGHDEREQTLNQLLVEMDGFEGNEAVIVIAATNRPDVLDPALLRPGRFDRRVTVGLPDIKGREQILKVHTRNVPIAEDVDIKMVARGTPGFSGAELANLVNEAALAAARKNKNLVSQAEFELAKDKLLMGPELRSKVMNEKEKINTAYHESGHAIVGRMLPDFDPVYKVTIIPRSRALGVTMYLPENERLSYTRSYLEDSIATLFAGRIAEELIFGEDNVTTGASNDIERATYWARNMVIRWGMSKKVGPQLLEGEESENYLGNSSTALRAMSDTSQNVIDDEIRSILQKNYDRAKSILESNMDILHAMKDALLKYETIDSEQIDDLMARRPVREPEGYGSYKNSSSDGDSGSEGQKEAEEKIETQADAQQENVAGEQTDKVSKPSQDSF